VDGAGGAEAGGAAIAVAEAVHHCGTIELESHLSAVALTFDIVGHDGCCLVYICVCVDVNYFVSRIIFLDAAFVSYFFITLIISEAIAA
jgi:hypothetical protein